MELATLNTKLRELAVQKTSGLLQTAEINAITAEENAIIIAADKIAETELNNVDLLSEVSIAISVPGTLAHVGATSKPELASGVSNVDTQMAKYKKALGEVGMFNAPKGHQSNMFSYFKFRCSCFVEYLIQTLQESSILAQSSVLNQSALPVVQANSRAQATLLTLLE